MKPYVASPVPPLPTTLTFPHAPTHPSIIAPFAAGLTQSRKTSVKGQAISNPRPSLEGSRSQLSEFRSPLLQQQQGGTAPLSLQNQSYTASEFGGPDERWATTPLQW